MVRANLLGLVGGLLSVSSVVLLWFFWFIGTYGFSSAESQLSIGLKETYERWSSILFMIGAFATLFTQLGVFLEIPAIVIFPFIAWWRDLSATWIPGYCVGLIGVAFTIYSCFVQATLPGMRIRIPPESRVVVWFPWREERKAMRIPRRVAYAAASIVIAAALISIGIVADAYTEPKSRLSVTTYIDSATYGAVDLVITLDGEIVAERYLAPIAGTGNITIFNAGFNVSAGSHRLTVDVKSNTHPETNNKVDYSSVIRVLPFTTEEVQVGIGVGFQ